MCGLFRRSRYFAPKDNIGTTNSQQGFHKQEANPNKDPGNYQQFLVEIREVLVEFRVGNLLCQKLAQQGSSQIGTTRRSYRNLRFNLIVVPICRGLVVQIVGTTNSNKDQQEARQGFHESQQGVVEIC